MSEHETALEGETKAIKAAMELRSGLRAESFRLKDRVRLLPRAQAQAGGHSGTIVGFERYSKRGKPRGGVLVALDQLPPVAEPVAVSPDLLEPASGPPA
jgi:hypothetical protein